MTFDIEKIEILISKGHYENSVEEIIEIIENAHDKELIYKSLSLLNLICDKSPTISLKSVKVLDKFINDSDSWIRLISLEILYQISLYRPNLLIDLLDKIRLRLFDNDASVRRLTVKMMGNLILSLHIDRLELQTLIDEFTEKLMDNDWKVKFIVIKTLQKILNQDYTKIKDLEPLLSIVIINLRDEDEDVARAAAELLRILGIYFLSKDKILYVLLNLLYNEKPRVKGLIIWLFGQIGKEKSSEIIPIIPKLINLLSDPDYRIQLKVIEALVNIGENNFDQIWSNLINLLDTEDAEFYNNLINALYHFSQKNITKIFQDFLIFEELENPSTNIRKGIGLIFKRLYEEYHIKIENEIAKILYKLESKYWRERKKTIQLVYNLCFILKSKKIAIWITIELQKSLRNETDSDVKDEINYILANIKAEFGDIDNTIERVKNELMVLQNKIYEFEKIPAQFRIKMDSYIKNYKFNDTEIELNGIYTRILKKIKKFDEKINKFDYKRLGLELIEDWEEIKIQVMDELSIIKIFIADIYDEKKSEFKNNLEKQIKVLDDRINVIRAQFDHIKKYSFNNNLEETLSSLGISDDGNLEEKFSHITQIRKQLFKLDIDIRELIIDNIEFNEIFKELLRKWINTKIQIQEYLSALDRQIKIMKDKIVHGYFKIDKTIEIPISEMEKIDGLSNELAFQLLQGHVQSVFSNGIRVFRKFNENFEKFSKKLDFLLKKKEFSQVIQLLQMNSTHIKKFIEETEEQIDTIIGREKILKDNNIFNLFVRPYLDKWTGSKELLINKLKRFMNKYETRCYLSQIKYYMKIMNPIKLNLLSSYINLKDDHLNDFILKHIQKGKLKAKILKDTLYSLKFETQQGNKSILFYKNIKTIGNKIFLNIKLRNQTNYNYKDLQISLKVPSYLKFIRMESFPKFLHLDELKPGKDFKFNYVLKIDKEFKKETIDPRSDVIKLNLFYKDPFKISRRTSKRIDLLLNLN